MDLSNEFADVYWDDDARVAVVQWKKAVAGGAFRAACESGLQLAIERGACVWYSDTRKLGVLTDEDAKWFLATIVPALLDAGITQQVLVVPHSVVSRMSLTRASITATDMGLKTKYLGESSAAIKWIADNVTAAEGRR